MTRPTREGYYWLRVRGPAVLSESPQHIWVVVEVSDLFAEGELTDRYVHHPGIETGYLTSGYKPEDWGERIPYPDE